MTMGPAPHPYVPFKTLIEDFSAREVRSAVARGILRRLLALWRKACGIEAAERRIAEDFRAGRDGFKFEAFALKELFYPQACATFMLEEDETRDPVEKAAQLVLGALRFRERVLRDELPVEYEGTRPLDMGRYRFFFSRLHVSTLAGKRLLHRNVDFGPATHVAIAIDGFFYVLEAYSDGKLRSYGELLADIAAMKDDALRRAAAIRDERSPLGVLTALTNARTAPLVARLHQENEPGFAVLDSALLLVAIDTAHAPLTLDGANRAVHADHFANRDPRRSMQIAVTANGRAGIITNPAAGLGGTLSAKVVSELFLACREIRAEAAAEQVVPPPPRPLQHLALRFKDPEALEAEVTAAEAAVRERLYPEGAPTAYRIDGIGRLDFARRGFSPDAAFHCAIRLAYRKTFGREPRIGNFVNLRQVRHGDIWRYCADSREMSAFVADPCPETFKAAAARHKELVKFQKKAKDEIYLTTMTVAQLYSRGEIGALGLASVILIMSLFVRDFVQRFVNPNLWLSHIPIMEGLEITGRAGARLGFLGKRSLGGHYMFFDDHIKICLLRSLKEPRHLRSEAVFAGNLKAALEFVKTLAERCGEARA